MRVGNNQWTTWSSLLASAIASAQALLSGTNRQRRRKRLRQAEVNTAADFTRFYYLMRENVEYQAEGRVHAARLFAEELRFFFGAEAVAIFESGRCVHSSLTNGELDALKKKVASPVKIGDRASCRIEQIAFSEEEIERLGANDNIRACTTLIASSGLGESKWGVWLWSGTGSSENERQSIFRPPDSVISLDFWRRVGCLLDLATASDAEAEAAIPPLCPPPNTDDVEEFHNRYREQFLPLDSILDPLHRRITEELQEYLTVDELGVSCAFSVRHQDRDAVHFYLTARQVRDAVVLQDDIAPLRAFLEFPYRPGEALSGWVMETGACLYLRDFANSNLWRAYIGRNGSEDHARAEQLNRVSKFFRVRAGNLAHAYLIPVFLQETRDEKGTPRLRTDLMLSITTAKELDLEMRRHIFNVVDRLGSAVGVALRAQREYESVVGRAILAEKVQPLTRFISHQLANRSNILNGLICAGSEITTEAEATCRLIAEDIGSICQIAAAYHQYLTGGQDLDFKPVDELELFVRRVWENARADVVSRDPRNEPIFGRSSQPSVSRIPKDFAIHRASFEFLIRNLIANSVDALDGDASGRIALELGFEAVDNSVVLSVTDNGPGVTESTANALLSRRQISRKPGTDDDKQDGYSGFGWHFIWLFCDAHKASPSFSHTNEGHKRGCTVVVKFPFGTKGADVH